MRRSRSAIVATGVLVIVVAAGGCDSGSSGKKRSASKSAPTTTHAPTTTLAPTFGTGTNPEEAAGAYVRSQGLAYAGDCAATSVPADTGKYCSALRDDGTDRKTYGIGPVAAEFTEILSIERRGTMWVVTSATEAPQAGA